MKSPAANNPELGSSSSNGCKNKHGRKLVTELTSSTSLQTETNTGPEIDSSSGSTKPTETELSFRQPPLRENDTVTVPLRMAEAEEEKEKEKYRWASVSQGSISVIGRQRVMEDSVTVLPGGLGEIGDFFGVYDGHGGAKVAQACRDRMHRWLAREVGAREREKWEWEEVMRGCFKKMDEEVCEEEREGETGEMDGITVGSTAAVVVVTKEEVVVSNCGDSRVVMCRGGAAFPLSSDHKPDRPDEMQRVEAVGGRVITWNGSRVLGVLATSRSIGDHYLKPYVSSEPEVTVSKRTELDSFLVIASDGLWDVVSNEVACDVVSRCLDGQLRKSLEAVRGNHAAEAAALLAELAMAKGSKHNISIIVVELNGPTGKEAS
ncbi:PPM-type phosphatase-like domain [Dillenia turbinata]|uniref:protein-serine/threonine phosphatase n=1 Tax=Dillenia turbinata TaxID=194707 RepID=A0AAN8ZCJ8_9MAGN